MTTKRRDLPRYHTYCIQFELSEVILQSSEVLPFRDVGFEPLWEPKPGNGTTCERDIDFECNVVLPLSFLPDEGIGRLGCIASHKLSKAWSIGQSFLLLFGQRALVPGRTREGAHC